MIIKTKCVVVLLFSLFLSCSIAISNSFANEKNIKVVDYIKYILKENDYRQSYINSPKRYGRPHYSNLSQSGKTTIRLENTNLIISSEWSVQHTTRPQKKYADWGYINVIHSADVKCVSKADMSTLYSAVYDHPTYFEIHSSLGNPGDIMAFKLKCQGDLECWDYRLDGEGNYFIPEGKVEPDAWYKPGDNIKKINISGKQEASCPIFSRFIYFDFGNSFERMVSKESETYNNLIDGFKHLISTNGGIAVPEKPF